MPRRELASKSNRRRAQSSILSKYLSPREQRLVQRVRARVRKILSNGEIQSLTLYGSRVYGKPRPFSDIDLFLVYDHTTPEQEESLEEIADDLPLDSVPVHVLKYRADKLIQDNGASLLIYNVSNRGITLEGAPVWKLEINRRSRR